MTNEEINYRFLRKIQQMEKNSPVLTNLDDDFYNDLQKYILDLKNRLNSEETDHKKKLLDEEILNTKNIATSIYEQREKKIVLTAISKARGGSPDIKNMAEVEKTFFSSILNLINRFRDEILENKKTVSENKTKPEFEEPKLKETEKEEIKDDTPIVKNDNTNPIARVIKDMPAFVGTDTKSYNIKKNDIVSLPEDMQEMLSKRKVVEKLGL